MSDSSPPYILAQIGIIPMEESRFDDRQQFLSMFDSCVVSPMSQVVDFPERWQLTDEDLTYVAGRLKQLAYQFDELARRNWRVN